MKRKIHLLKLITLNYGYVHGWFFFLTEIFTRIINEDKKQNLSNSQILTILNENVYGIEIDNTLFNKAIQNLNEIVIKNGLKVNFNNLKNENTLLFYKNHLQKLFIVLEILHFLESMI